MNQKQVRIMVMTWQERLGLGLWEIAVVFQDNLQISTDACQMTVHRSQLYHRATITVDNAALDPKTLPESIEKSLIDDDSLSHEDYVERGVVHELLHLALRDLMEASDLVREDVHPALRMVWDNAFKRAEEDVVDQLARALVANWNP